MKDTSAKKRLSDEELVDRARDGDLEAMDHLVLRYHEGVYRVALGILRNEEEASDAAQETFLRGFRGLGGFRGDASFKTWILTIAANEAKGILRKASRKKEIGLDAVGPVASREVSAEVAFERSADVERVKELLSQLPEKQRETVTLRIFEDLSFREIGTITGSSEGAARVNFHHGIRRLREMLG